MVDITAVEVIEGRTISLTFSDDSVRRVDLTEWLGSDEAPAGIVGVISPAMDIPLVGDGMIAPDEQMAMISVQMAAGPLDEETKLLLEEVQAYLEEHAQPGLNTYLTGNAPIFNSRSRIVWHCAFAIRVPFKPSRRNACTNAYAADENHSRI